MPDQQPQPEPSRGNHPGGEHPAQRQRRPDVDPIRQATRLRTNLGSTVRTRRETLGLTEQQLADATGLQHEALVRFEEGRTTPSMLMLQRFAEILGLRLSVELLPMETDEPGTTP